MSKKNTFLTEAVKLGVVEDDVTSEFDKLDEEVKNFTNGNAQIAYSIMDDDEKKVWFTNPIGECYFINFVYQLKRGEGKKKYTFRNTLAAISYSLTFPAVLKSALQGNKEVTCNKKEDLVTFIKKLVSEQLFIRLLLRAKNGLLNKNVEE